MNDEQRQLFDAYLADWQTPMKYLRSCRRRQVSAALNLGISYEDLESEIWVGVAKAASTFDLAKSKNAVGVNTAFATHVHYGAWSALSQVIYHYSSNSRFLGAGRKMHYLDANFGIDGAGEDELHKTIGRDETGYAMIDTRDESNLVKRFIDGLPDRQRTAITAYYSNDVGLKDLARGFKVSVEMARKIKNRAMDTITNQLQGAL